MVHPLSPSLFLDLAFPTRLKAHLSSYLPPFNPLKHGYVNIMCWNSSKISMFLFLGIVQMYTSKCDLFSRYRTHHHFGRTTFKDRCLLPWCLQYHIIPCIIRRCHGISSGLDPLECMVWGLCPAAFSTLNAPLSEWVETGGPSRGKAVWHRLPTPRWNVKRWKNRSLLDTATAIRKHNNKGGEGLAIADINEDHSSEKFLSMAISILFFNIHDSCTLGGVVYINTPFKDYSLLEKLTKAYPVFVFEVLGFSF